MREMAYTECGMVQGGWLWRIILEEAVSLVLTNLPAASSNTSTWGVVGPGSFNNFNASSINAINGSDKMSDTYTPGGAGGFGGGGSWGSGSIDDDREPLMLAY